MSKNGAFAYACRIVVQCDFVHQGRRQSIRIALIGVPVSTEPFFATGMVSHTEPFVSLLPDCGCASLRGRLHVVVKDEHISLSIGGSNRATECMTVEGRRGSTSLVSADCRSTTRDHRPHALPLPERSCRCSSIGGSFRGGVGSWVIVSQLRTECPLTPRRAGGGLAPGRVPARPSATDSFRQSAIGYVRAESRMLTASTSGDSAVVVTPRHRLPSRGGRPESGQARREICRRRRRMNA